MLRRVNTGWMDGYYGFPAGHKETGESFLDCAIREVKEEVGLDITIIGDAFGPNNGELVNGGYRYLVPPRYMGRHPVKEGHEHIVLVYFATTETSYLVDSVLDHEKWSETKWVTIEELETMNLLPNVKFYAQKALQELSQLKNHA
jgi:8-oxo-dGTP pyrophosphatase MutT (NUDIX family)